MGKDIKIKLTDLPQGETLCKKVLADNENTLPTSHDRIRIAQVREYEYDNASLVVNHLEYLSRAIDIPTMVQLMKQTVPEYHTEESK